MPENPESLAQMAERARQLRHDLTHLMRLAEQTIEEGGDTHDLRKQIAETKQALTDLEAQLPEEMASMERRLEQ